jgi:hypothetical protein
VLVPVLILLACFAVGVMAAARWLPDLAPGSVGGLAFFAVCGLLGVATALLGVHVYLIVDELEQQSGRLGAVVLADGLLSALFEAGSLLALAAIVYLLAPTPDEEDKTLSDTGSSHVSSVLP